jgi:ATP-dependent DNA helicase RecG
MKLQINESQNIEFKQSWKDEYIKWLSAFGNSDGGKLYIGADDDDEIVGIDNAKKLQQFLCTIERGAK